MPLTPSQRWKRGLLRVVIAGASVGLSGALGASMQRPDVFNLSGQIMDLVSFAIGQAVIGALLRATDFLRKQPTPPIEGEVDEAPLGPPESPPPP